jgi:hypothetical protein
MADEPTEVAARSYPPQAVQMVRTITQTHLALSQMADQKASILMGATFVVFTITVGQVTRGSYPLPLMVLACFSFLSAIFAVAVVMPSLRVGQPGRSADANMLFFGVFTGVSEDEFAEHVLERIVTDEGMFRMMLRDVYQNGQVLQRKKYRYLAIAYRVFLIGLTLTLAALLLDSSRALAAPFPGASAAAPAAGTLA